jgi:hypothetical protein
LNNTLNLLDIKLPGTIGFESLKLNKTQGKIEELILKLKSTNVKAVREQTILKPYVVKVDLINGITTYGWINTDGSKEYDEACVSKIAKKLNITDLEKEIILDYISKS